VLWSLGLDVPADGLAVPLVLTEKKPGKEK
jgi:hypothetical protein